MNYYERHIGDYLKDTAHLSLLEHGIYTRLMDVYYTREGAIPANEAARLIGARSKDEREALQAVLAEYFVLVDGSHQQVRCEREIERYRDKQAKAKRSAEARWGAQRPLSDGNANASADAMRTHSEGNAPRARPQSPVSSNQTPGTTTSQSSVETPGVEQALSGGTTTVGEKTAETAADAASTPPAARGTRLPNDWHLPKAWGEWALAEYPLWTPAKVRLEGQKFRDHWTALTGKAATKTNWQATWRNWCRSDIAHRDDPKPGAQRAGIRLNEDELRAANAAANAEAARLLFGGQTHTGQEAIDA